MQKAAKVLIMLFLFLLATLSGCTSHGEPLTLEEREQLQKVVEFKYALLCLKDKHGEAGHGIHMYETYHQFLDEVIYNSDGTYSTDDKDYELSYSPEVMYEMIDYYNSDPYIQDSFDSIVFETSAKDIIASERILSDIYQAEQALAQKVLEVANQLIDVRLTIRENNFQHYLPSDVYVFEIGDFHLQQLEQITGNSAGVGKLMNNLERANYCTVQMEEEYYNVQNLYDQAEVEFNKRAESLDLEVSLDFMKDWDELAYVRRFRTVMQENEKASLSEIKKKYDNYWNR